MRALGLCFALLTGLPVLSLASGPECPYSAIITAPRDRAVHVVTVSRKKGDGGFSKQDFDRTNRSVKLFRQQPVLATVFSREFLAGKRLLDVGTGDGQLVIDLINEGNSAVGLDLVLRPEQKEPSDPKLKGAFVEGDAFHMPFEDGAFDVLFSSNGPFSYLYDDFPDQSLLARWRSATREVHRVTKSGGTVVLFGFVSFSTAPKAYEKIFEEEGFDVVKHANQSAWVLTKKKQ